MPRLITAMIIAALAAPAWAEPATPAEKMQKILAVIDDPRGAAAPGCAVGLFENGKTVFAQSGAADISTGRKANAETLFYTASVAKQFTALAVAQLVAGGKISLDDDIRKYLPEMPVYRAPVTVGMLLHHSSGVRNTLKLMPLAGFEHWDDGRRPEVLKTQLGFPDTAFLPGATYEYTNGGFLLLSEIVQRVSGLPFPQYMRQNVLQPMGMTRTLVLDDVVPTDPNAARGYLPKGNGFVVDEGYPPFGGAGGMKTTINDLARYHEDIVKGHKVWTPEVAKIMTTPGILADGTPVIAVERGLAYAYAGGLMLSHDWIFHAGGAVGFRTLVGWLPGRDLGIAMLCNNGAINPIAWSADVFKTLYPSLPIMDTPRFILPQPAGRFLSHDIPVAYRLDAAGEGLKVTITGLDGKSRSTEDYRKTADGIYAHASLLLTFDPDGRGFVVSNGPTAARFYRAP
jgi:CubicO group peptidase (beta-lactamase class C family)